jgi:hypothetical protein
MVATFEAMFAALGITMFPVPFCTMTARRLSALGMLITGLPGVTAVPFTNTVGETELAVADEFAVACELGTVCPRADAPPLFCAEFNVVFSPVCAGATDDAGDAVTTGVATGVDPCTALGTGAVEVLAPVDAEGGDCGVADAR